MTNLHARIVQMHKTFKLPINDGPTDLGEGRIDSLWSILQEEVDELMDTSDDTPSKERLVHIADLLADMVVYCRSEAVRWGIPIDRVLNAVMDSQFSKLDESGEPIFDERGKFLKGPNYQPPEPAIRKILFGDSE